MNWCRYQRRAKGQSRTKPHSGGWTGAGIVVRFGRSANLAAVSPTDRDGSRRGQRIVLRGGLDDAAASPALLRDTGWNRLPPVRYRAWSKPVGRPGEWSQMRGRRGRPAPASGFAAAVSASNRCELRPRCHAHTDAPIVHSKKVRIGCAQHGCWTRDETLRPSVVPIRQNIPAAACHRRAEIETDGRAPRWMPACCWSTTGRHSRRSEPAQLPVPPQPRRHHPRRGPASTGDPRFCRGDSQRLTVTAVHRRVPFVSKHERE